MKKEKLVEAIIKTRYTSNLYPNEKVLLESEKIVDLERIYGEALKLKAKKEKEAEDIIQKEIKKGNIAEDLQKTRSATIK